MTDKLDFVIYWGGIGASKTEVMVKDFILDIGHKANNGLENSIFGFWGYSVKQLKEGVIPAFERNLGSSLNYNDHRGEIEIFGNRALLLPARQSTDFQRFRSYNMAGGAINEATNSHEKTWAEMIGRMRDKKGGEPLIFADLNPTSKNNHLYRKYFEHSSPVVYNDNGDLVDWVQYEKGSKALNFHFTLHDNSESNGGFLSDRYIERITSGITGNLYKNLVLGEWGSFGNYVYDIDTLNYCEYESEYMIDGKDEADLMLQPSDDEIVITSIDPAGGLREKSDFIFIVTGAWLPSTGRIRLLRVRAARKIGTDKPSIEVMEEEISKILNLFGRIDILTIEADITQEAYIVNPIIKKFKNRVLKFKKRSARAGGDKHSRILNCEAIVKNDVIFPREWRNPPKGDPNYDNDRWAGYLLIRQLCNIKYDSMEKNLDNPESYLDGADSLEGLIRETRDQKTMLSKGGKVSAFR